MSYARLPDPPATRPIWLMTLADLSLLLVGFMVLLQATHLNRGRLSQGLRQGFKAASAMPVEAAEAGFARGSAVPDGRAEVVAWVRDAARDPRVAFTITGSTDGTPADVDPATGSAAILAADRARATAAAIAVAVPDSRLSVATTDQPGRRAALVTLAFAGEPSRRH